MSAELYFALKMGDSTDRIKLVVLFIFDQCRPQLVEEIYAWLATVTDDAESFSVE